MSGAGGTGNPIGPKVVGGNNTTTTIGATYDFTNTKVVEGGAINTQVYPNPTNGTLTVDFGATFNNAVVEVVNAVGQTVYTQTFTNAQRAELNLEGAAGMYMVTVRTESGEKTMKVVKE